MGRQIGQDKRHDRLGNVLFGPRGSASRPLFSVRQSRVLRYRGRAADHVGKEVSDLFAEDGQLEGEPCKNPQSGENKTPSQAGREEPGHCLCDGGVAYR
jgi:hypothetical protein